MGKIWDSNGCFGVVFVKDWKYPFEHHIFTTGI